MDFNQCALYCTLKALSTCRTVTFDNNALQPEKARPIVPGGSQISLQTPH